METRLTIFKEIFISVFAIIVVGCGIMMVSALIFHSVPPENKDIITVSLGTVLAGWLAVINYYFGSSKGSSDKDKLLAQSTPQPTKSVTVSETEKQ